MPKKAKPIAELLRKDVVRPKGEPVMSPVYRKFNPHDTRPAPQVGEVLMWDFCYTPLDLHCSYDTRDPDPDGRWEGIDEFYDLLKDRCRLNRRKAAEAMNVFNKWLG